MPILSDEFKEQVRAANDIVSVVQNYVVLKRSGRNYMGLCPFHNEKSASFSVSPEKQYFHCFGCGKGGDVFTFVSEIENIPFKDAIEKLAERAKIPMPISDDKEYNKTQYLKDRMFKINIDAAEFYHERLYKPLAKIAQDYVKKRKMDKTVLEKFKLGYSGEYDELYKFLKAKGYNEKEMLETGLVKQSQKGGYYDFYRKRLMFPIMNVNGKVVAFSSRKLDENDKMGKYVNSMDNLIYHKRQHLFGMYLAKLTKENTIVLVEGNMDVISLHQRGIDNVVASLGTALTDEQVRILMQYGKGKKIILSQDADEAGQAAIIKSIEILEKFGLDARVLQIDDPEVKDPDEYIIKYGAVRFKKLIDNAISLVEFKIKMLKNKYNLDIPADKVKFLHDITKVLASVESKIEREIYIDKASKTYNISKDAIYAEVNKILYKNQPGKEVLEKKISKAKPEEQAISEVTIKREKMVLYLLINYAEEVIEPIKKSIKSSDFKDEINKKIFDAIISSNETNKEKILSIISNIEDADIQSNVSSIMLSDYEIVSSQKATEDIIASYERDKLEVRKQEIIKKLENPKDLSPDEEKEYYAELKEIIEKGKKGRRSSL